eukprot:SAG22_NODE_566_length_9044_cov_4.581107_6_plen_144_part_00
MSKDDGAITRQIEVASGCSVTVVGHNVCFAGYHRPRERATSYLKWVLRDLRAGDGCVPSGVDAASRDDVVALPLPLQSIHRILRTKTKGKAKANGDTVAQSIGRSTGTILFVDSVYDLVAKDDGDDKPGCGGGGAKVRQRSCF